MPRKRGGEICIIAVINEAMAVRAILAHLDEPTLPPRMARARGPPLRKMADAAPIEYDPQAQPALDYEFDQCIGLVARRESDLARRRALVPWATETASAGMPATLGTTCVVILARFSRFISMHFLHDDC